jgi:NRAMP (natural resistance-associated macrophage protein)-like metal ion transporter
MPNKRSSPNATNVEPASVVGVREASLTKEHGVIRRFLKVLGPGIVVGASDDDPSGIGTYSVAGAGFGFSTLWTALITFPMMAAAQFISAKIGLVTGKGLGAVLRQYYHPAIAVPLVISLAIANTINAGADIGAIAASVNLILPVRVEALIVPIAAMLLALMVWGSYRTIASIFKWLALALFAYIGAALFAHPNAIEVLKGTFVPRISWNGAYLATLVGILGTTISPYMFFWQATQEVEEDIDMGRVHQWQRTGTTDAELKYASWDINAGMLFSNIVMYFIILATAATLYKTGHTHINTAADAAQALEPIAGKAAGMLLALGMIGAGFLAVPILIGSSAYAMSEVFGWRYGLSKHPGRAPQFYVIIILAMVVGIELNFIGISPILALFWTAVLNGFLAPVLLLVIMLVSNNRKIMGDRTNGVGLNILGWATTIAMALAAVALIVTWGK